MSRASLIPQFRQIDMNAKFHVYRRSEVGEHLVWRTCNRELDWFVLREGDFQRLLPDSQGLLCSPTFPRLWLDAAALLRGDPAGVLKRLNVGLATPEHSAFVARLCQTDPA